ncbi:MAG TPA: class I SAM-dependent methyltransferase [Burkholderiaceae bacterium]|nr:class I SAM-dependent methyltransferase [Burkholderiaceae bacterium]
MANPDPTQRFSDRADAYAAARPSYPDAIAPLLVRELALPADATVADLGYGTGLSCVPFLRAGLAVIGVEPNDAMRTAGEKFLAAQGSFRSVAGKAEATTLADASVDLVVAAQAAHWFDLPAAHAEALRILRRPPRAALIWNDRLSTGSAFAEGYEVLLRDFGAEYLKIRHRHAAEETVAAFFGGPYRETTLPNTTRLDFPTLVSRVDSASYMPQRGSTAHAAMVAQLRKLFDASARDGMVAMEYVTRIFFGELAR